MDGTNTSQKCHSFGLSRRKRLQSKRLIAQKDGNSGGASDGQSRKRHLTSPAKSELGTFPAKRIRKLSTAISLKVGEDSRKNAHQIKSSMTDVAQKGHVDTIHRDKTENLRTIKSGAKSIKERPKSSDIICEFSVKEEKTLGQNANVNNESVKGSSLQFCPNTQKVQKIPHKSGIHYEAGFRLEALDKLGKWYPAKIISVDEEEAKVLIHFERWNSRYDEWLSYPNSRLRPSPKVSGKNSHSSKRKKFVVGDIVMARWTDRKMYPAKITDFDSEGYLTVMFYDGIKKLVKETNVSTVPPEMENKIEFSPGQPVGKKVPVKLSERSKRKKLIVGGIFQAKRKAEFLKKTKRSKSSKSVALDDDDDDDVPSVATPTTSTGEEEIDDAKVEEIVAEHSYTDTSNKEQLSDLAFDEVATESSLETDAKKVARKEFIIEEDHNHFKCTHSSCGKSFRKEKLLHAHIKHYHDANKGKDESYTIEKSPVMTKTSNPSPKVTAKKVNKSVKEPEPVNKPTVEIKQEVKSPIPATPKDADKSKDKVEIKVEPELVLAPIPKPVAAVKKINPTVPGKVSRKRNKSDSTIKSETSCEIVSHREIISEPSHADPPLPAPKPVEAAVSQGSIPHVRASKRRRLDTAESIASTLSLDSAISFQSEADCCVVDVEKTEPGTKKVRSRSKKFLMNTSSEIRSEIINCSCGLNDENGFMVQCELCLSWQHGTCANIAKEEEVPIKYVCNACLNPKLGRESMQYHWDLDWFRKGEMPKFNFLEKTCHDQSSSMLSTHNLAASLLSIQNVTKGLRYKLKIATNKYHPDLDQFKTSWNKDCKPVAEPPINNSNMEAILSGISAFDIANLQQTLASNGNDAAGMYFDPSFFPASKSQDINPPPGFYPSSNCNNATIPVINSQSIDISLNEVSEDLGKIEDKNLQILSKKKGLVVGENLQTFYNSKDIVSDEPVISQPSTDEKIISTISKSAYFVEQDENVTKSSENNFSESEPSASFPIDSENLRKLAPEQSDSCNDSQKNETIDNCFEDAVNSTDKPEDKCATTTIPPCKEGKTLSEETSCLPDETDHLSSEPKTNLTAIEQFSMPTSNNTHSEVRNILDHYISDVIPTSLSNVSNAPNISLPSEPITQQSEPPIDQNVTASTEFGGSLPISMSDAELVQAIGFSDATINSCQQTAALGADDFMASDAMMGTLTKEEEEMIKTLSKPYYPPTLVPREPDTEHYQKNVVNHVSEVLEELDHRLEVLETQIEILEMEYESQHSSSTTKNDSVTDTQMIKRYMRDMEKLRNFVHLH